MKIDTRKILGAAAAIGALLLATGCSSSDSDAATDKGDKTASGSGSYKAGQYSADGEYTTPGGKGEVSVDLTISSDGTISAVTVTPKSTDRTSWQFQTLFASEIDQEVVGKKIDSLSVDKVAGSSLTHGGFEDAVEDIIEQAQA